MWWKNAVKAVSFLFIMVLTLNGIYRILSWKDTAGNYISSVESMYATEDELIDVLFLGSSHCYASVNNAVLWDAYGMASFSLAISGQDMASTYYCFKEALKTQKPKVVLVELFYTTSHGYGVQGNLYRNTLPFRGFVNYFDAVQNIVEDEEERRDILLKWPILHTRYAELQREDFVSDRTYYRGYDGDFQTIYLDAPEIIKENDVMEIGEEEQNWLYKIKELADEAGCELCFFVAPYAASVEEQRKFHYVRMLAEEMGVPYINLITNYEDAGISFASDFRDWGHNNSYGAEKVSRYLGEYLLANYEIPDRRGDERYYLWEKNSEDWKHQETNYRLTQITDMNQYLGRLERLDNYVVVLCARRNFWNEDALIEQNLKKNLAGIGIQDEFFEKGGTWVIKNNQVLYYSEGEMEYFYHMELSQSDLVVKGSIGLDYYGCDYREDYIGIDEKNHVILDDGINIVVYDELKGKIVDVVSFYAPNAYECIR